MVELVNVDRMMDTPMNHNIEDENKIGSSNQQGWANYFFWLLFFVFGASFSILFHLTLFYFFELFERCFLFNHVCFVNFLSFLTQTWQNKVLILEKEKGCASGKSRDRNPPKTQAYCWHQQHPIH